MNLKIFFITASLFLAGCASISNLPLSEDMRGSLAGKTFVYVEPMELQVISVIQPHNALDYFSGLISASEHEIENPAKELISKIIGTLENNLRMDNLGVLENANAEMNTSELSALNSQNADYIISTNSWHLIVYFPLNWGKYKLAGSTQFKLIDGAGVNISSGHCVYPSKKASASPTYEELFLNDAQELKSLFREATEYCDNEFSNLL